MFLADPLNRRIIVNSASFTDNASSWCPASDKPFPSTPIAMLRIWSASGRPRYVFQHAHPVRKVTKKTTQVNALEKMKKLAKSAPRSCDWVAADPGHRCDERGTVAAEDACHAACYAQELKNLKRETWSAKQPLRAP